MKEEIMNLTKVLAGVEGLKAKGSLDIDINHITQDTNTLEKGDLFIAVKGFSTDGHKYIPQAIAKGAAAIMIDEGVAKEIIPLIADQNVTIVTAPSTRIALAKVACNYYENPSRYFQLIGITGTKGKTTTSYMTKSILEKCGIRTGLIGTIEVLSGGDKKITDSARTTPDPITLQKYLAEMKEDGCQAVVMEVSSQALKIHRVDGCDFNMGVFMNFSEDHISPNEHPDMEDYFNSKVKLFSMCPTGFINTDDLDTIKVPKLCPNCNFKTFGIDNQADILAKDITVTNSYVDFKVKINGRNERVKIPIPGRFNVYNGLAAISIALQLNCPTDKIIEGLAEVKVKGRSEMFENDLGLAIIIDFAHSPESLRNVLLAAKGYTKGKVICVFGCSGDRDTRKRPMMGEIAGSIADYTFISTTDPRSEDPNEIVKAVEEGMKKTQGKYEVCVDRAEADKKAVRMCKKNDIVVLCGRGHETMQEIKGVKHHFDERDVLKEVIAELKANQEGKEVK
jgi:UDP-N-acetylmuramoyl-L-alanyl-D-glutamate--2,6-diaminopimelate ligase